MVETETGEQMLRLIENRRSMALIRPERPSRDMVTRVLEAAAWAPNHHKTEPWRFFIVAGDARHDLGDVFAEALRARLADPDSDESRAALDKERKKPLRAPVVLVAAAVPSDQPRIVEIEEVAATAAAVENILLAAQAVGLAAMWRTGTPAYEPAVKRFLGLPENAHIVAFVYLGFPGLDARTERRRTIAGHTKWLGWED